MAKKLGNNIPFNKNANIVTEKLYACGSALDDLKDIYSNKLLADVKLETKTNSFPAHKVILCARSLVFRVMFTNDMKQKNSDSVQVDDLEDDTVQQLLLFLYSDKVEDLQWHSASKLYYAADKYQIEKLKLKCSSFLIENLAVSSVTELLVLADSHSDSDLQQVVEDFILEHEEEVFASKRWDELMEAKPQLALKLMHLKYKTKKRDYKLTRPPMGEDPSLQTGESVRLPAGKGPRLSVGDVLEQESRFHFASDSFSLTRPKKNYLYSTPDFRPDVANVTKRSNGRYQQKQKTKFPNMSISNIAPESSYCENFDLDNETQNFVDTNFQYSQRPKISENSLRINVRKRVSPELHGHVDFIEARRRRFYHPEKSSGSDGINNETSKELHKGEGHQQNQMNKFQDSNIQNTSPKKLFSAHSDEDTETDKFSYTNYSHKQMQKSTETLPGIVIKKRVSSELDSRVDSTAASAGLNLHQMQSRRMLPSDRTFSNCYGNFERFIIFWSIFFIITAFGYIGVRFFIYYLDYPPALYKNDHLSATNLMDGLRSKFEDQPTLTYRVIGTALKNVLEPQPNFPAIILLLATNGSQTVCSDFAMELVDSLSVPKYTLKIYGENFKLANAKQAKMEIDLIIGKTLKFDQMGAVLIRDLDHIPGQAAIILHKYYDHENAPFKKAVFVMTVNYNKSISDYHDLKVWHKAANDYLLSVWEDTGIDQLSALLSRLTVNVAIITTENV